MKQLINIVLAFLLFHTSAARSAEIEISCNIKFIDGAERQRIYVLNLEKLSVSNVAAIPPQKGKLVISDKFYQMIFSETKTFYASTAVISRYSGEFKGEVGSPPFGAFKKGNHLLTGKCEKMKNKKLF